MPVDYSKWDALELSDDSDVEVHPNVDKRSFIRAKQNQIHQERQHRKQRMETLKYEHIINDALIKRISALLGALKARAAETETRNPGEVAFQAVMESAGKSEDDQPPPRPEGVHGAEQPLPTYTKMMATLLDQVNKALDEKKPENRYKAMVEEIEEHLHKVQTLQEDLVKKLADLQKEESSKITSESIHTGFDSSHINKSKPSDKKDETAKPELLNPNFSTAAPDSSKSAKAASADDDDEAPEPSPDALEFSRIRPDDYQASLAFLSRHPHILTERETDALLVAAFNAALEARDDDARRCVHQALLLQYCRALGRDGVALFFRRITTRGHQAQDVFARDVRDTYGKIKVRAGEILAKRQEEGAEGVEQIQLHAVEPGTVIQVKVPPADAEDEEGKRMRAIYDEFPADMKKALETGELDEVNRVLGEMKVDEAEAMVEKFSDAGILSIEELIDTTTEEGRKHLKEMQEAAEAAGEEGETSYPDPE